MRSRWIRLSAPRRFMGDLLHFASGVPTVPVERRMSLAGVVAARGRAADRPGWSAIFLAAYARVADDVPELRRAYVTLPWPHLREYPTAVASLAVEREYGGENGVFFARITSPGRRSVGETHALIRRYVETPVEEVREFRKLLAFARWPRPVRRGLFWLGLNLPRTRPGLFGTFGLSVYSALGAESLHPLSPLTTTLNYGVIEPDGTVAARLTYDHRVFDGATAARVLRRLEEELNGSILRELVDPARPTRRAA